MNKRIGIIGGGAAGMMVAATLVERFWWEETTKDKVISLDNKPTILLFEKNKELGTKVRISGWGRCNVTTWYYKKQDLQTKYTRWRDFLSYAMGQFWPRKMAHRCESHGVPLTCEPDMRVFPTSSNSHDIVGIFQSIIADHVDIHFNESVTSVQKNSDNTFTLTTPVGSYTVDVLVVTTWGNAYTHTGSAWDGYDIAQQFWHTITPLGPSLNSFLVAEDRIKECSGISFPQAKIRWKSGENTKKEVVGPVLCTHFGISWPATFSYSSQIPYTPISATQPHTMYVMPYADRSVQRWTNWLENYIKTEPKRHVGTVLGYEFTKRWVDKFLEMVETGRKDWWNQKESIETKVHSQFSLWNTMLSNLSREQKKRITTLLWEWLPLTLIARRPWDEFVTAWWVSTDEVNPETMESKLCPGLYFAGEVLNIDAVTWGFNFQSCRAAGRCAGNSIFS